MSRSLVWATFTDEEKASLRVAAASVGLPMSQFVRNAALEAAEKALTAFRKGK